MEHTLIITPKELEDYSDTRESEAVVPELIWLLVNQSTSDLTVCRIPYGGTINQPGWDGLVETSSGFRQYIPQNHSYWEIGTGRDPQEKATDDFRKRTEKMSPDVLKTSTFVFVTSRSTGSGGWPQPKQTEWKEKRKDSGWKEINIIDGIVLADWLREFPVIGKWLLKKMGIVKKISGFSTPAEHWENLQNLVSTGDPPIHPKIFLVGRDKPCTEINRLFLGDVKQLALAAESEQDAEDFIAAFLASLDDSARKVFGNRCLFTPALHKNVIELEAKSSSFCQIVDIRGEKFFDVLICADRKCGHTTGLREPTGPVDDVSTDSTDMMEGPKLYTFESGISLSVGSGHLELAA